MKTIRTSLVSLFFATVVAVSSFAQSNVDVSLLGNTSNAVVLSENFNGTILNTSEWETVLPYNNAAVAVEGASCRSSNRGYIKSTREFTGDVEINFMVKLTGVRTAANFFWKTDGEIMGPDRSCTVTNGLNIGFYNEAQVIGVAVNNGWQFLTYSPVSTGVPLETWIAVRIVDLNNVVSVYINGSSEPMIVHSYDPMTVARGGKLAFASRESAYCGPVSASITSLTVTDLSPDPVEVVVELDNTSTVLAMVTEETTVPTIVDTLPTVEISNATTGNVVASDVVITGNETADLINLKVNSKDKNDLKRKAYGIAIARKNKSNKAHCAIGDKLPPGIYVFSFQPKVGAKNVKFSANVVEVK